MEQKKNKKKISRYWMRILQFAVTIVLFVYIIKKARFGEAVKILDQLNVKFFVFSLFVLIIAQFGFIMSWYAVIKKLYLDVSLKFVSTVFFQSLFVNNFLTFIGGDFFRVIKINAHTKQKFETGFSLLISRYMMVFTLILISGFSLLLFGHNLGFGLFIKWIGLGLIILCTAYIFLVAASSRKSFIRAKSDNDSFLRRLIKKAINNHIIIGERFPFFLGILFLNIAGHFIGFASLWLLAKSLGIGVSFLKILSFMPLLKLVLMIPVSFNGFGIREMSFVAFLTRLEYSQAQALSLGLAKSLSTIIISLLGGLLLLLELIVSNNLQKKGEGDS